MVIISIVSRYCLASHTQRGACGALGGQGRGTLKGSERPQWEATEDQT